MDEFKNRPEPKKIKMPSLVDRSVLYDTLSFESDTPQNPKIYKTFWQTYTEEYEDYSKDNSQGLSELEFDKTN
jgi:hypothetical protein